MELHQIRYLIKRPKKYNREIYRFMQRISDTHYEKKMKVNFLFVVLNRVKNNQIIKFTRLHFFQLQKSDLHFFDIIFRFDSHTEKLHAKC